MVDHEISLVGDPETKLNVAPVDEVMEDVRHLIRTDFAGGPIYHLTSDWWPPAHVCLVDLSKLLDTQTLVMRKRGERELSALEALIARRTDFYASYLDSRVEFQRSVPRSYGVDNADLRGYLTELFRELGREAPASVFAVVEQHSCNQLYRSDFPHYRLGTAIRFDIAELKAATARRGLR